MEVTGRLIALFIFCCVIGGGLALGWRVIGAVVGVPCP